MPDLNLIFSSEDPGFLRLVAEFWGIEDLDADFDELFLRRAGTGDWDGVDDRSAHNRRG